MPKLTKAQVDVLRKLVKDGNLRKQFASDPTKAIALSGVQIPPAESARLTKIKARDLDQLAANIAAKGGLKAQGDGNGTQSLVYATSLVMLIE
jgi:phage terminase Nu1 subunit (DNA packaging protein)